MEKTIRPPLLQHAEPTSLDGGSDRSFGLTFAFFFLFVTGAPLLRHHVIRWWALPCAMICGGLAVLRPDTLAPFNRAWTRLSSGLAEVMGPVWMALFFFGVVTPMAMVMRLVGRDPLRRKWDPKAPSYWIAKDPERPDSLKYPF